MRGTRGVRKARALPGSLTRRMMTPVQTRTKAKSVPDVGKLHDLVDVVRWQRLRPNSDAGPDGRYIAGSVSGVDPAKVRREKSVARHGKGRSAAGRIGKTSNTALMETTAQNDTTPAETSAPT